MIAKLPAVLVVCFLASILQQRVFAQNVLNTVYGDPNDYLGISVSGAGDVDNDGFADSLVGAPEDDTNGALCGMIRVYSGRTGAVLYSRYGDAAGDMLGDSVSDVGDVNGDGFDDFIAGAGSATWNGQQVGMMPGCRRLSNHLRLQPNEPQRLGVRTMTHKFMENRHLTTAPLKELIGKSVNLSRSAWNLSRGQGLSYPPPLPLLDPIGCLAGLN